MYVLVQRCFDFQVLKGTKPKKMYIEITTNNKLATKIYNHSYIQSLINSIQVTLISQLCAICLLTSNRTYCGNATGRQGKRHSARKRVAGNYSLVCERGQGGQSLLLPMPHSPTSRTFVPLCLLTPALHCVAPIFFEVNQED